MDFKDLAEELKTPELCLAAVQKNGMALRRVPEALMTPELCLAAVQQDSMAFKFVPESLRTTEIRRIFCLEKILEMAIVCHGDPKKIKMGFLYDNDWEVLAFLEDDEAPEELRTMEGCRAALKYMSKMIKKDKPSRDLLPEWQEEWSSISYLPETLKTAELCRVAVEEDGFSIGHVPKNLLTPELCRTAVAENGHAFFYVPKEMITAELCRAAVEQNGCVIKHVPARLVTAELCDAAIAQDPEALQYVPEALKTAELCRKAVEGQDGTTNAIWYVPEELKTKELLEFDSKAKKALLEKVRRLWCIGS